MWFSVAVDGRYVVATRYGLGSSGIEFRCDGMLRAVDTTHPLSFAMIIVSLSWRVKRSEPCADHLHFFCRRLANGLVLYLFSLPVQVCHGVT